MILRQKTIDELGHDPDKLPPRSQKPVWVECETPMCRKQRIVRRASVRKYCQSCAQIETGERRSRLLSGNRKKRQAEGKSPAFIAEKNMVIVREPVPCKFSECGNMTTLYSGYCEKCEDVIRRGLQERAARESRNRVSTPK